jgi:hypothetical protein
MHRKIVATVLIACLTLPSLAFADDAPEHPAAGDLSIRAGRITTTDARFVEFRDAHLADTEVTFDRHPGGAAEHMDLDGILRIEKQTGNNGATYALVVGGSCLVGALLGVASSPNEDDVDSGTKTTIVAALTGLGVVLGYIVGSGQKTYETVYENPILDRDDEPTVGVTLEPGSVKVAQLVLRF